MGTMIKACLLYTSTHSLSAASSVHGDVTTTDNSYGFTDFDRGVMVREIISFHQVDTGEEFVGGINAHQVFTRNFLEVRQTSTRTDEHSFKAFFFQQFIEGNAFADDHIWDDFDA